MFQLYSYSVTCGRGVLGLGLGGRKSASWRPPVRLKKAHLRAVVGEAEGAVLCPEAVGDGGRARTTVGPVEKRVRRRRALGFDEPEEQVGARGVPERHEA